MFLNESFKKKSRKPQSKKRNKNAWLKPQLKNRANSGIGELWLCGAEEGVPFRHVTRIQVLTLLKN